MELDEFVKGCLNLYLDPIFLTHFLVGLGWLVGLVGWLLVFVGCLVGWLGWVGLGWLVGWLFVVAVG